MQHDNPLPPSHDEPAIDSGVIDLHPERSRLMPLTPPESPKTESSPDAALNVIRAKLDHLYADAPDPFREIKQTTQAPATTSKHQAVMQGLQTSGRSLAEVQTAWHNYYVGLPDHEKHEVWREFYAAAGSGQHQPAQPQALPKEPKPTAPAFKPGVRPSSQAIPLPVEPVQPPKTAQQLRSTIRKHVNAGGRLKAHHHLQSLGFGLAVGLVTLAITLFSFFNEVIIAPFIQPGRAEGATPIIIDPSGVAAGSAAEVIIPKINLEIPVDYSQTTDDEAAIENGLEHGVVHYPSTVLPGQEGNAAFFGHSSNNIFNPGQYKFAFVLLHELQPGDTFYLSYHKKVYVYKVFKRIIVEPEQVDVLDNIPGHVATATLITCDPPGTSLHRLVVVGDQISPDPGHNAHGSNTIGNDASVTALPDNGPSLWDRLTSIFTGN